MNGQNGQHHSARPILPFRVTFIVVTRYGPKNESLSHEIDPLPNADVIEDTPQVSKTITAFPCSSCTAVTKFAPPKFQRHSLLFPAPLRPLVVVDIHGVVAVVAPGGDGHRAVNVTCGGDTYMTSALEGVLR